MNRTHWPTPAPRLREEGGWFGALVGALIFVITLRLGISTAGTNLDESWSAVIAWAHVQGAQWGSDIVFTYGPLGWLNPYATYYPTIFTTFFVSQIVLTLGIGVTFGLAASLLRGWGTRLVMLVVLLVLSPRLNSDVLLLGTLILAVAAVERAALVRSAAWRALLLSVVAVLCATLGLVKFTFFPLAAGVWLVGTLLLAQHRRALAAVGWLLGVPAAALALWLANGQAVSGFPAYLLTSLEMASAYSQAMGAGGADQEQAVCLAASIGIAALLLAWLGSDRSARLRALMVVGYLAAALFIAWRASFTRADHAHIFLPLVALALLVMMGFVRDLLPQLRYAATLSVLLLSGAAVLLIPPGATLQTYRTTAENVAITWNQVLNPATLRANQDAGRAGVRSALDLPRVREIVGTQRVDLLTSAQGVVLVNELNYAPRPVFQSYAAYSPRLQRLNEGYFLGSSAPPFVLLKIEPIDARYPTSEDGLALLALWRNYRLVEIERGFVLLKRVRDVRDPIAPAAVSYVDAAFGEWIDVPAHTSAMLMHLDLGQSLRGKLMAVLLREPPLLMEVTLDTTVVHQYRLVRAAASGGFLLSPYLVNEISYVQWMYGDRQPAVQRVRFTTAEPEQLSLLAPRLRVGFTPQELPIEPAEQLAPGIKAILYPGLDLAPTKRHGMIQPIVEDGRPALFMHALSTMDFSPAPGRYRLTTRYGMRGATHVIAGCAEAQADGIQFQIDVVNGDAATLQLQRNLNPFTTEQDRGLQTATLDAVQIAAGDSLRVTVAPGANGNLACDWGYLAELRLQPLPP